MGGQHNNPDGRKVEGAVMQFLYDLWDSKTTPDNYPNWSPYNADPYNLDDENINAPVKMRQTWQAMAADVVNNYWWDFYNFWGTLCVYYKCAWLLLDIEDFKNYWAGLNFPDISDLYKVVIHPFNYVPQYDLPIPYNLQATIVDQSIKLTWAENTINEGGFWISRKVDNNEWDPYYALIKNPNQTQYYDNNVSEHIYKYKISAISADTSESSTEVTIQGPPNAPSGLTVVGQPTPNQVKLQWTDNSQIEAKFWIARATDGVWKEFYNDTFANITTYLDTVSFLHKYAHKVRAVDNAGHYSAWSNVVEFVCGTIAQSNYSRMSAFNNGAKVLRGPDGKIHITYADISSSGWKLYYTFTSDGYTFREWKDLFPLLPYNSISNPALAINNNGQPLVGYCATGYLGGGAYRFYVGIKDTTPNPPAILLYWDGFAGSYSHPSFVWAADTSWIVFRTSQPNYLYLTSHPSASYGNYRIITTAGGVGNPVIGYDKAGRLVILSHTAAYGGIRLWFRTIDSSSWSSPINISNAYAYGEPSLWTGTNELRITFEGAYGNTWGIIFIQLNWNGSTYAVQSIELVSENTDYDDYGIEGYSYLASKDVVLWKYGDDIHYARRIGTGEWQYLGNLSQPSPDISSYPQGIVYGSIAVTQKLFALWTEKSGNNYYLVRKIINLPPTYPSVRTVAQSDIPEATGFNNSRRFIRDGNGILHLAFTCGDSVYHTFLQDTSWSEPVPIGQGKYPALALDNNRRIHCIWSYNQGLPYFLEELRYSCFDDNQWSPSIPLMHTYNSFLWGVGAPSLAIKDSFAYITFKSYFGPTYHPEPGGPAPQVIILESRNLIYGKFNLNNPLAFTHQSIDAISITPTPYDPYVYQDSLVPLLISPSITVDLAGIPHILWEGDSTNMRYYTIVDTNISLQVFDENVDFPFLGMHGDQIQLFYTARDSIRYRYSWTGTTNLSETQTVASCESPISSGQYLTWTKQENGLSHLYYGAIPASGQVNPIEVNYSTDLISYPQILFNSKPPSIDLVWTEYSEIDSVGYIYYLNLPLTEVAPKYAFDMGTETPVPICVQRDGYKVLGIEDYKTFDYDSTELIYHLTLHSPHIKYKIRWVWYHEEQNKIHLKFNIDDIFHRNRWVKPKEKITEEGWIPPACVQDNEITIRVKVLNGPIAVLSGFEIYAEEVGGGGPQGGEAQITRPFFFDRIYPNPAKGIIRLRFNSPDERKITIKLYDVSGRLVHSQEIIKSKIGINEVLIKPDRLSAGVYFVRLETKGYEKIEKAILLK